jgi:hypothetical protein
VSRGDSPTVPLNHSSPFEHGQVIPVTVGVTSINNVVFPKKPEAPIISGGGGIPTEGLTVYRDVCCAM